MDKEKLSAARKRLKEFQRNRKGQTQKNAKEITDQQNQNYERKTSLDSSSPDTHHNASSEVETRNMSECPTSSNEELFHHSHINQQQEHPSVNGITENMSSHNNFIVGDSSNNGNSIISSEAPIEIINQNNKTINTSSSLQKEHLLQMANAVADVLVDEQSLDETALNNCDLEQRNQFLTCCLEEQKKIINELNMQIGQSNSRLSELEAIVSTKNAEFESRLIREVNPLKEQVQLDAQTIGILVGEKAELTAINSQCQATIKQKTEEVVELTGKLKTSHQRVTELERELTTLKNTMQEFAQSYQNLQKNYEELEAKSNKLMKDNEDFELETSELRQKLNYKNTEVTTLNQELQEKIALLSLSELRMQQLSNSPQEMNSLETQHHATKMLEQQLSQMKEALENVNGEKDEVSKKYQSYVQQLDEQHNKLLAELESSKKTIADSEIREQSYIQRLSELEQQLQREKTKSVPEIEDQSEKIEMLTKSMDNLVLEQENFQSLLNEKDNEIESLRRELKELQDIREQSVEASKLAKALQGEQLGASRAVSQNQQLKTQLDEMHDAFIALSNTKLDLTEQLQAERTIGKKLNAQLNIVEQQLDELKEELDKKEAALVEFEKEKLHAAQIEDQIQHYQAQSHSANTLQEELRKALITVDNLKKENQLLQSKLNPISQNVIKPDAIGADDTTDRTAINCNSEDKPQDGTTTIMDGDTSKALTVISENNAIVNIPEAFEKLESRFKETMEKLAEVTDEKQRLEHLVLQLQGETETIGEYVTLYQKQRAILQEKAKEKEKTFQQLLEQRNQLQEQLHKLKLLVAGLLKSKNSNTVVSTATIAEEGMILSDNIENESNGEVLTHEKDQTTSQILDLLTEIKDCSDVCITEPNFHPCPWCSGKLITV
ncbi:golgin subfamily A member 2 [Nasonia vitripennis]|uniref:Golgin subfamily A conserved domain-containing protein n=1 Tax=Nasonia vitripennis TaxID=7425 RepID=A0A7M7G6H6_NASVI|nr:golgin subfamily A member 2 [Nasonia vitripennis]